MTPIPASLSYAWPSAAQLLPQARRDRPQVGMIVAHSRNRCIGRDNQLPWQLPDDLQQFKAATLGTTVVMGRNTWLSLARPGQKPKPLPHRNNVVLSRQATQQADLRAEIRAAGAAVVSSLAEAIKLANEHSEGRLWIIGGGEVYRHYLGEVDVLRVTEVDCEVAGDTFFPALAAHEWQAVERQHHPADARHAFAFDCVTWQRNSRA